MKSSSVVIGFSILTLAAACSQGTGGGSGAVIPVTPTSSATAAAPPSTGAPATRPAVPEGAVKVSLTDFAITPATFTARAGAVVLYVSNDGRTPHNLSLYDAAHKDAGHTAELNPGQAAVLNLNLAAGSYHVDCSLPGHESLGMTGILTVS